jgi:hypothetical protein
VSRVRYFRNLINLATKCHSLNNSLDKKINISTLSDRNQKYLANTKTKSRFCIPDINISQNYLPPKKSSSQKFHNFGGMLDFSQEKINYERENNDNLILFLSKNFKKDAQVAEYANTPNGSRILQRKLTNSNHAEIQFLLEKIMQFLPDIMTNSYGNYFCKEFFHFCSNFQKIEIFKSVSIILISIF